jgi:hypothetical protein
MYVFNVDEPAAFKGIKTQHCFFNVSVQTVQTAAAIFVCSSFSERAFFISLPSSVLSLELFAVCAALPSVYLADEYVGWLAVVSPQVLYNVLL